MKLLPVIILLGFFLVPLYPIYAQDASPPAARKGLIKERVVQAQERVASRAAVLKDRLKKFRDKRKAEIAERVNDRLARINEKRTQQMLKHLEKMLEILTKLEDRVNQAGQNGKDTSVALSAIASAKNSIDGAKLAVEAQADNDYTIEATSEATIRADSKATRDALHDDLKSVRKLVIEAKQAVANAIRTAATSLGGENGP